jgi:hypothetical protein
MKTIKYAIFLYLNGKRLFEIGDVNTVPSFKIGDAIGLRPFDVMYEHDDRAIVIDVLYDFLGDQDHPEINLFVHLKEESSEQTAERQKRTKAKDGL